MSRLSVGFKRNSIPANGIRIITRYTAPKKDIPSKEVKLLSIKYSNFAPDTPTINKINGKRNETTIES